MQSIYVHIIGSLTLMLILTTVSIYLSAAQLNVQASSVKHRLREVASYLSHEAVNLLVLMQTSNSQLLVVRVEVPKLIGNEAYTITLLKQNGEFKVRLALQYSQICCEELIPINSTSTGLTINQSSQYIGLIQEFKLYSSPQLYSGVDAALWCRRGVDGFEIGLGVLRR
jgi:hypothetical protein